MNHSGSHTGQRKWLLVFLFLAPVVLARPFLSLSLWADEASSVWFASLPESNLLTQLCDPHPPGFYLGLKYWLAAGEQELWLRLPSLWSALLSIALVYRLGTDLAHRRLGLLAALLLAAQPLQIWYAAELRMYTPVQLMSLAAFWLGWRFWSRQTRSGDWLYGFFYILAAVFAFWIDYSAIFAWGLLQLWWLSQGRARWQSWLSLQAVVLLLSLLLVVQVTQVTALGQAYQPVFVAIVANRLGLAIGPTEAARLLRFGGILMGGAAFLIAWQWGRWSGKRPPWLESSISLLLAGSWLLLLLITAVPRLYTVKRLLIVLLPYLALLAAYAFSRWPRSLGYTAVVAGLLIGGFILPTHQKEPWRTTTADVAASTAPKTVVWVDELVVPAFTFYAEPLGFSSWAPLFGNDLPHLPDFKPEPGEKLLLITGNNPYRQTHRLLPVEFHAWYELVEVTRAEGIQIFSYRRREERETSVTISPPTEQELWGLLLPSPLATCSSDAGQ